MKFRVERDVLAEAVTWVARGLPARPPVPVLAGILMQADDGVHERQRRDRKRCRYCAFHRVIIVAPR